MSDQSAPIKQKDVFGPHWEYIRAVAVNASGTKGAYGGNRDDGLETALYLFDPQTGKDLGTASLDAAASAIAFYDDDILYCGQRDGGLTCWDTSGKKPKAKASYAGDEAISALAVSADGETVFVADQKGTITALSAAKLKAAKTAFAWPQGVAVNVLVADPKGSWLAAAGDDGIIRVYNAEDGEQIREMPGHEGAINDMLIHPQDYRLISTGADRSIRLWYLQGDVEFEDRAESGSHDDAITSMALGPVCKDENGEELPPRLFTGSADGTVKIWPMHNKRKPKTFELGDESGAVQCVISLPTDDAPKALFAKERVLFGEYYNAKTEPEGSFLRLYSDYHKSHKDLQSSKKEAREKAVKAIAAHIQDPDVYELLLQTMQYDDAPEVRAQAATELATPAAKRPIQELRGALDDSHTKVRKAALETLRSLQGEKNLSPLSSALRSGYADTRKLAIKALLPLHEESPQVSRMLFQALSDSSIEVKVAALDALEQIYPSTKKEPNTRPHVYALRNGDDDLIREVLHRIHDNKWSHLPVIQSQLDQMLGQFDESIRHLAFHISIAGVPELTKALCDRDDRLERAIKELDVDRTKKKKEKDDDKAEAKKTKKTKKKRPEGPPPQLDDGLLQPLFKGMMSPHQDLSLRAAALLATLQDLRAFSALLQHSRAQEVHFRVETAQALALLNDPRVLPNLKRLLNDNHKDVRNTAFESLLALSDDVLDVAEAALDSGYADTRNRALQQLVPAKGKTPEDRAYDLLVEALNDGDEGVRNEAFKVLWNAFKKAPGRCLLPALQSRNAAMRSKAMDEIVGNFGKEPWAVEGLHEALQSDDKSTREAAYKALIKLADKNDPSPHEHALKSEDADLRMQAVTKLQSYKADDVKPLWLAAVGDEDQGVRTEALERMLKRFSKDADLLAQTLEIPHWDVRLQVASHLAHLGDARALEVASSYLEAEQALIKELLPPYIPKDKSEIEVLPEETQQEIRASRLKIIEVVWKLGLPEGVEPILPFLEAKDKHIVNEAAFAITRCASEAHFDLLRGLLGHKEKWVKIYAAEGLLRHGSEEGLGLLHDLHRNASDDSDRRRCLVAYYALGANTEGRFLRALSSDSSNIREDALALLLAREWQLALEGEAPAHLTTLQSLSQASPRQIGARMLARRVDREAFVESVQAHLADAWPEPSNKTETSTLSKATKKLPHWLAALNAEDPTTRFEAASLLDVRRDPAAFVEAMEQMVRHRDEPKPPKLSKKDNGPSAEETATFACSASLALLTRSSELAEKQIKELLDDLVSLVDAKLISTDAVMPSLRYIIEDCYAHSAFKPAYKAVCALTPEGDVTPMRVAFQSPHASLGLGVLADLAKENTEQARDLTIEAMQSEIRDVRFKAAEQLANYYDEDSLEPMILALESTHADVRLKVVDRLSRNDDERVLEALETALGSDDDALRLKAAETLANRKQTKTFDVLVDFLNREDYSYQTRAASALVTLGAEGTAEAFIQRIEEDPEETAETNLLIRHMGTLGQAAAIPWLTKTLDNDDYYTYRAAYESLTSIPGPKKKRDEELYLTCLQGAIGSKNTNIRNSAIGDLREVKGDQAREIIAGRLDDRDEGVRSTAINALSYRISEFGESAEPLLPLLNHKDTALRFEAACILAEHGKQEAFVTLFTNFQTSMESDVQQRAVEGLGKLGDQRAFAPLHALWAEDAEYHPAQAAAAEALGRLAPEEQRAEIKALLEQLMEHNDSDVRIKAMSGMRYLDPDNAINLIGQAIKKASGWSGWQLREAGAEMLGEIGSTDAEDILTRLLKDDDSDVARAAIKSLLKIFGEDNERIQMVFFDSQEVRNAAHETWEKAATYVAEAAPPVEVLKRLPWLLPQSEQSDLFLDEIGFEASEEEEYNSLGDDVGRLLQKGLLGRDPLPVKGIKEGIKSNDLKLRTNAVYLLSQLDDKSAAKAIKDACKQLATEWEQRSQRSARRAQLWQLALWSVGRADPAAAADVSVAALESENAPGQVKAQAATLLGRAGKKSKAATAALESALSHPQEKVRRQAHWALSELGASEALLQSLPTFPSASQHLLPEKATRKQLPDEVLLSHPARRELLPALISQGQSGLFIEMADSTQAEAQQIAIHALARIANEDAIAALDKLRKDEGKGDDIRREAFRAYRRAQRAAKKATQAQAS